MHHNTPTLYIHYACSARDHLQWYHSEPAHTYSTYTAPPVIIHQQQLNFDVNKPQNN